MIKAAITRLINKLDKRIVLKDVFSEYKVSQKFGITDHARELEKDYQAGKYKNRIYRYIIHTGIDYSMKKGTPVFSPIKGVVVVDDDANDSGRGIAVSIWDKDQNVGCRFYHLSKNIVEENQKIEAPQLIGYSGNTDGNSSISTGAHLHFELVKTDDNGKAIGLYNGAIDPVDKKLVRWVK
jgi:murein DD-endopeptidase MepM/ murein hydrolase activator NlpD